jgi:hypothetical protein
MNDIISYIITYILFINGFYDITCSASILWLSNIPGFKQLSLLHPTMYSNEIDSENPVVKRLLAYWLMTYGVVRLVAGCKEEYLLDILGAITYFIEAFCFEYENRVGKTLVYEKAQFVWISSACIGALILLRPFGYL